VDRVCPFLRLAGDPHAAVDGVEPAHRCQATDSPSEVDRSTQARLCLTVEHARCERFLARRARDGVDTPARQAAGDGFTSTRLLLTPQPAWRGLAGRGRRPRRALAIGVGAIGLLGALGGAGLVAGAFGGRGATPQPSPSAAIATSSPTARLSPTPRATLTLHPTPSATPTTGPTASPRPTPTSRPTPEPATAAPTPAPRTYTVVAGDTLALIAQRFGTTVAALQAANNIDDPDEISVGQVLIIP